MTWDNWRKRWRWNLSKKDLKLKCKGRSSYQKGDGRVADGGETTHR